MNILFVNNFRGRGGGEEFLRDLLPGLAAKGVTVGLVCRPHTPLTEMFRDSEVEVFPVDRSGFRGMASIFTIARIIRDRGYQIVNIQRGHDIIQSWLAALLSGKNPVLLYTPQVPEFLRSRFLLRRMAAIATISRHIRDRLAAFDPRLASRITIIYYGIDLERFQPAATKRGWLRTRFGLGPETRIIGAVGDLWKNQIEFLDVLALLRKRFPDIRYAMVASETGIGQIEEFKRRAADLGLTDSVLWAGRLSKNDMLSFYADIDLAVSTYRNEGFGIWILEAMAMGKPVVAYNAGGIRDSLEGCPAGRLVDGGAQEMASAIGDILERSDVSQAMTAAAPAWVAKKYRRERMVDDYYSYFQQLQASGGRTTPAPAQQRPLGILQIISKNDRYGAQRIFLDQVAALQAQGDRVFVVARGNDGFVADTVRSLGIPYAGIAMKGISDLLFLRRFVKEHDIDIIHTTLDRADLFGIMLARISGLPVVSTMMTRRYHPGYRFMDRVVVLSHKQRAILEERGIPPSAIDRIRPGIDVDRFFAPRGEVKDRWTGRLQPENYSIIFCHIASLIPRKAHSVSLDLVAECKARGERPLLIIVGDSKHLTDYEFLLQCIDNRGLTGQVLLTGWTADIPELLSFSHFTILPSEQEALGVVLMEGMAAGTPVIAREGEGGAELIEEYRTGLLYRPEAGVPALAEEVLALYRDHDAYQALSRKCRDIAKKEFTLASFGVSLSRMYRKAIEQKAGRVRP